VNSDALQRVALAVAQERDGAAVLPLIVRGLCEQGGVALARLWLLREGDVCATCALRDECADRARCLHLVASHGTPRRGGDWSRVDGRFQRVPLNARKVGVIGATGAPLLVDLTAGPSDWIADPAWAKRERLLAFAGQPLVFRGEVLGVLGVFSRERLGAEELGWLRTFADQAGAAIANARAFAEIERLRRQLELENDYLREQVKTESATGEITGSSPALWKVLEQVRLVAPSRATVLVTGESGTGKELVARAIHEQSDRRARPLIKVNCASVPRELFESEFFGHVKGAFSGALRDRVGRFELADGGTLFLDEVGELPLDLQGKLLRALQEGTFERVGDEATRRVDVRVIAATNRRLEAEVAAGRFRADLYFRLSVFPIEVPPLRERRDDIPLLVRQFVTLSSRRLGMKALPPSAEDLRALSDHDWPGNVRELQNVVERAVILSRGRRLKLDVGARRLEKKDPGRADDKPILTDAEVRRRERDNVLAALERTGWRVHGPGGAARLLGLKPTTLVSRMKAMGIKRAT
jgi:transcriptional regulator with GAF, ATPase, and Fis domain